MSMIALTMVTFPIVDGIYGMDRLAKKLNELVRNGRIYDWHPGPWIDWDHHAIEIGFESAADAAVAEKAGRDRSSS